MSRASFTRIQDGTREDWQHIRREFTEHAARLPDRVIAHLNLLAGDYGGFPVDRLTHCLQTATRALRGGRDDEYVVCALLHDIGDTLSPYNHPDLAAAILKPYVSAENHWMVQHHGYFQGFYYFHHLGMDRNARDQFAGHPLFDRTLEFCELYDGPAFDERAETLPLAEFEPLLRRVLSVPKS